MSRMKEDRVYTVTIEGEHGQLMRMGGSLTGRYVNINGVPFFVERTECEGNVGTFDICRYRGGGHSLTQVKDQMVREAFDAWSKTDEGKKACAPGGRSE